ncbi:MAG: hypothetical protein NC311_08110 [Muribaculaceae bacterium]|nr:hypothetical protein [Muribaculaceae bacterium]MCM1439337.1 phage tail sheath family protein [Roseburia sp.]
MSTNYRHGIYVSEQGSSMVAPVTGTAGLQVVIGTAPVHLLDKPEEAVNKPVLAQSYQEAVAALGYSADFEKYTICEAVSASFQVLNVAPLVLINVLDPKKHSKSVEEIEVQVNDGLAAVEVPGILLGSLKVRNGETELTSGEDYTASFDQNGMVNIAIIAGGKGDGATALTVSGKALDPGMVTAADIVGGVDAETGAETGMEVIRQIYPKLGLVPGILLAPRFSADATVTAALQGKCHEINGTFKSVCVVDVDSGEKGARKYTDVKEQKEKQAISDACAYAVWPYAMVGETVYSGSVLAAARMAYTDAQNGDIPYTSPSNKGITMSGICLADGTEVVLDQDQANAINSYGVATFLNMNGYRLWGNNTAAYPGNTDPKDRFLSCRRYMNWRANSFILTYFQKVDDPMNRRLIEAVVDSENVRGNGYVAIGAAARDEIVFNEDENPTSALLDGRITFHQYMTPFTPAEDIEDIIEFDPSALSSALG